MIPRWEGSGSLDSKRKRKHVFSRYLFVLHPLPTSSAVDFGGGVGGAVRVPNLNSYPTLMASALFPLLKMETKP